MTLIKSDAVTGEFSKGKFLKLSERPPEFREKFQSARKAIEDGLLDALKEAVQAMKRIADIEDCLDVCDMVPGRNPRRHYPMTLLAFAGYYGRRDMLRCLLSQGAHIDMGNKSSGTPLLQMLNYSHIQQKQRQLDINIVQFFIDEGAVLSRVLSAGGCDNCTALEMSINLQRFDISQKLIEKGVDPIDGGDPNMMPIFVEYVQFGTNNFIKRLLEHYQKLHEIPTFVDRLLACNVFSSLETNHTAKIMGRNVAHAFLLSGHHQAISRLLEKKSDLLKEKDPFMRTALHLAAFMGDSQSVKILLQNNADVNAKDKASMTPAMLATKNGHTEVVKLFTSETATDMGLWSWALQYNYPAYFEAMHKTEELEEILMSSLDKDGNTIAHLAAEGGHVSVFKATFPKTHQVPLFEILKKKNKHGKTPLHLAIEKGNIRILNALQEHRADREKQVSETQDLYKQQAESIERMEWKAFWDSESPELIVYACVHGTVEIVKYFVTELAPPTSRFKGKRPLSYASEAGNHEIVAYLLSLEGVTPEGVAKDEVVQDDEKPNSPLMLASLHGHAKSVTLLLEHDADTGVLSERGYNCLMECIKAGHKDVAIAILTHPCEDTNKWKETMRCRVKDQVTTPMRMLIEHMPDVARIALTKCLSSPTHGQGGSGPVKKILYDYEFIEDYNQPWTPALPAGYAPINAQRVLVPPSPYSQSKRCFSLYHPLTLMVKHERLELLQHPLISRYIAYKWWRLALFLFLFYVPVYIIFLILLTSFALSLPRPGPDDEFCPGNNSGIAYSDADCREPDGVQRRAFTALAVILSLLSIAFLVFEMWIMRFKYLMQDLLGYFADYETIIRVGVFLLTIIFVFGFWNDCWCAPPWQWQIGALAIFLAYINFILIFKRVPWFGVYINMLFNIIIVFLKLIYLPVFLIFSFAIPFYMLFVRDSHAVLGKDGPGILKAFSNPARSMAKAVMQTTGELDYDTLFNEANLLYSPMAYILFISFVVLMPILFSNLLIGLAVGTTEEDKLKATFTNIQLQVNYILGLGNFQTMRCWGRLPYPTDSSILDQLGNVPFLECNEGRRNVVVSCWDKLIGQDYKTQEKLYEEMNNAVENDKLQLSLVVKSRRGLSENESGVFYEVQMPQSYKRQEEDIQALKEKMAKLAFTLQEMKEILKELHKL